MLQSSRISRALAEQGFSSCVVFQNNLRLHPQSVEEILLWVREAIQEMDPSVIVFYCLASSRAGPATAAGRPLAEGMTGHSTYMGRSPSPPATCAESIWRL
jgi:hypothetical protein